MLDRILNQKALLTTILVAVFLGGIFSYTKIGKLEDAEIPVKTAVVITMYPGATAHEVELEVTKELEEAIQKLENIKDIQSVSMPGMSQIIVNITSSTRTYKLPQLWDHLRRKVNDAKSGLPKGAREPLVVDDFSDTYGMFKAVSSDGYSYKELSDYVNYLRRGLLEVKGVRKIVVYGEQTETVEICFSAEKLATIGLNPMLIVMAMNDQSSIVEPGAINSGSERIRLSLGNKFSTVSEIEDLLVQVPRGGSFRLGDIAEVKRSYYEPKYEGMTFNGMNALGMGISVESGVNVIKVGEAVDAKILELMKNLPAGIEIHDIYSQPSRVDAAVKNFMWNLVMSVGIVIAVLLFSMGFRSGLLISSGLVLTILGTLMLMFAFDMQLHRVTLASIILAMGMLVDNSIVVTDGILMDLKKGVNRRFAFTGSAIRTAMPLLGATLVAILAFLPLGMSPGAMGEFLKSLFYVLTISLLLSWVFSIVQTPFMAKWFYRKEAAGNDEEKAVSTDPFSKGIYPFFRRSVEWVLAHKKVFLVTSVVVLLGSLYGFRYVKINFMPGFDYNQFYIEYRMPNGSNVDIVEKDILSIRDEIMQYEGVEKVTTALGRTPARYTLARAMNTQNSNYGELIVDMSDYEMVDSTIERIEKFANLNFPHAQIRCRTYRPSISEYLLEIQFTGPDPAVLRDLAEQAKEIMRNNPKTKVVTDDWKNEIKVLSPTFSVEDARRLNISRKDVANSLAIATTGMPVGALYEGKNMLPVMLKLDIPAEDDINELSSIPVWGQQSRSSVPLAQVTEKVDIKWENDIVRRYNGKRAIKAQCDPVKGVLERELYSEIKDDLDAISLPDGYNMSLEGTLSRQSEAQGELFNILPFALGLMLIIIISLFNNFKQPLIIFMIVPFAFIGIVLGFILTGKILNFIGIIGALGLIGMMIKNSVVLLDEINLELKEGKNKLEATVNSAVSRMRPVIMASFTTILGMLPLLWDVMFQSMAITIMFGLLVGTLITLYVVPVMYSVLYKVDTKMKRK